MVILSKKGTYPHIHRNIIAINFDFRKNEKNNIYKKN